MALRVSTSASSISPPLGIELGGRPVPRPRSNWKRT